MYRVGTGCRRLGVVPLGQLLRKGSGPCLGWVTLLPSPTFSPSRGRRDTLWGGAPLT